DGAGTTGRDVRAVANGRVVVAGDFGAAWGNVVAIDHLFYKNNERKELRSVYAGLGGLRVRPGEYVRRGQTIGTVGLGDGGAKAPRLHVQFQIDGEFEPTFGKASATSDEAWVRAHLCDPSAFVASHRSLLVPQNEDVLLVIDSSAGAMRLYSRGRR